VNVTEKNKTEFIQKYKLKNKFIISSTNRMDEYKGIQHIIQALPNIVKKHPETRLLIMCRDDGYLMTLKSIAEKLKVKKFIRFIENISEQEKFTALTLSKIFIFSSIWEAFGIVMLEAMLCRNALISTKTEGGRFLIKENINGFLYDFGDVKSLLEKINILIEDKNLREKFAQQNLENANFFDIEFIYRKYYKPLLDYQLTLKK